MSIAEAASVAATGPEQMAALQGWLQTMAVVGGVVSVALTGWGMFLNSKIKSLDAVWRWKDTFSHRYEADKLEQERRLGAEKVAATREFVSKAEAAQWFQRVDEDMRGVRSDIRALGAKIDGLLADGRRAEGG